LQPRRVLDVEFEGATDLHGMEQVVHREMAENLFTELEDVDELFDRSRFADTFGCDVNLWVAQRARGRGVVPCGALSLEALIFSDLLRLRVVMLTCSGLLA
jgi:hypothetical protein